MGEQAPLSGPDLAHGIGEGDLADNTPLLGHAHGEAVVLVRDAGKVHALGATCSHYGGPLAEGLVHDGAIRCPWHHACFDLATGTARRWPRSRAGTSCSRAGRSASARSVSSRRPRSLARRAW